MTGDQIRAKFGRKPEYSQAIYPPALELQVEQTALIAELIDSVKELIATMSNPKPVVVAADEPQKINLRKANVG